MKPLVLRLQAFGPYSRSVEIDFRSLADGGLFLIHGQTGAGKTSLLDGLSFALFGKASGSDRTPSGLRSDLAAKDLPTEASLEFSLGSDLYRVTRSPEQTLKKKRGDGVTSAKPEARLEKWDGTSWALVVAGVVKTDDAVVRLLGMTDEQFRQVVVLPQGQFRKFLSSNSSDREELLEQLFKTERYRRLVEELDARAKAAAASYAESRTQSQALLASLDVADTAALEARFGEVNASIAELASGEAELNDRFSSARRAVETAREQVRLREELAALVARRSSLATRARAHADLVARLETHRHAQPVLAVDARVSSLVSDLARIVNERLANERALPDLSRAHAAAVDAVAALEARAGEISAANVRRENLRKIYVDAEALKNETLQLKTQQHSLQEIEESLKARSFALEELKRVRPALDSEIARLTEAAAAEGRIVAEIELLKRQQADAAESLRLAQDLVATETRLTSERAKLTLLDERIAAQTTQLKTLKLEYHRSQAARLAAELAVGGPCPVCGSTDHPSPARAHASNVTTETLDAAENVLVKFASERAAQDGVIVRLQTEISRSLETLRRALPAFADEGPLKSAEAAIASLREAQVPLEKQRAEARTAGADLMAARRKLEIAIKQIDTAQAELTTAAERQGDLRAVRDATLARIHQLSQNVPEDLRDLEQVKREGLKLKEVIDRHAADVRAAALALEQASRRVTETVSSTETLAKQIARIEQDKLTAEVELAQVLAASGLASVEVARAAAIPSAQIPALEKERRDYDTEHATVESRFAEVSALVREPAITREELARLESAFGEVDALRTQRTAQQMSLRDRLAQLTSARAKLLELSERSGAQEKQHAVVARLADAAQGRAPNLSRVGFQRYVLGSRLDEVLEQASRRLHTMSRGQFALRRARQLDDKRKSAGLDLEVEDALSGTSRPTASLSGGEGFLASLALALGLADVVQNHLGGVRLDAVFVDEGFGTLDPEALEQAMRTLTDLQAGGRMVGIISHVPELRDQIARRLIIKKGAEGSTVEWE